jgi:hypothetical protein
LVLKEQKKEEREKEENTGYGRESQQMYRNSEKKNQIGKETVAHASNLTYMGG